MKEAEAKGPNIPKSRGRPKVDANAPEKKKIEKGELEKKKKSRPIGKSRSQKKKAKKADLPN